MYKTFLICIMFIIAISLSNCKYFEGNDEQVKQNTSDIKELKTTVSSKADRNDIKALEEYNKECDKRHSKSEDRLTSLEQIKNAKITSTSNNTKSKIKKTCNKPIKNAKNPVDINDVVAGYGENDFNPIAQADIEEISQPKTIIPENKSTPEKKNYSAGECNPLTLIELMQKQEALTKNSLDYMRNSINTTDKIVDQHNTAIETSKETLTKHENLLKQHDTALNEQRKTIESHDVELKQAKDYQATTESRLRVLETDMKQVKESNNNLIEVVEVLKTDVNNIKTDLKAEEPNGDTEESKEE